MITLTLPEDIFKPLFHDLALSGLLSDGKSLADAIPLAGPGGILENYEREKGAEKGDRERVRAE